MAILILWCTIAIVQGFLSFGTAYRLTTSGGGNGVALLGWQLALVVAACIPGLGLYLWQKYKDEDVYKTHRPALALRYYPYSSYRPNSVPQYHEDSHNTIYSAVSDISTTKPNKSTDAKPEESAKRPNCITRKECKRCHALYNPAFDCCPECGAKGFL